LSVVGIQSAPESDNIRSPESCRRWNQSAENLPVPEYSHRRTKFRLEYCRIPAKPAGSGRIRLLIQKILVGIRQWRPDVAEFRRHLLNSDFCIS
jgi:hypothetical protein